ncbi:MAG: DUF4124 domain-containing protein [Gammaproteobacteria bacterium]|jgi:hypothetical protein
MARSAKSLLAVTALLLLLAPALGVAAAYKWVDQDGVTHYGSQPPTGQPSQEIKPPPPPPSGTGQAAQQFNSQVDAVDKRLKDRNKQEQEAARKAQKQRTQADNCRKAREQLHLLQTRNRIQVSAGGTVHTMTTEERATTVDKLQRYLDKNCAAQ